MPAAGRRQRGRSGGGCGFCLAAAVAAAAAGGCERLPVSAVQQIRQANDAYLHGQLTRGEQLLNPVIARYPDQPDVAEAYYLRSLCRTVTDRREEARSDLRTGLGMADRPELVGLMRAQLGNLEYEAGRYDEAARQYSQARPYLPLRPPTDRVLLRYGISLQRSGQYSAARRMLLELLARFPIGPTTNDAQTRLAWPHDFHSVQCGVFTKADSAQAAARDLRDRGLAATSWQERGGENVRYVVRTGRYPTYAEAEAALPQVRALVPDAFIVP